MAALVFGYQVHSAQAGENISGFLDASGRVVFVNEPSEVVAGPAALKESATPGASNRKVLARAGTSSQASESVGPVTFGAQPWGVSTENDAAGEAVGNFSSRAGGRDQIRDLVSEAARRHQVDADLVHAIVQVESNYNPYAVSNKGARGLMQLIPATARRFGVGNSFDPQANLDGGIRYLKYLMGMFKGDLRLSLAAYNAGEMAVARNGGVPPYRETRDYIRKISELYPMRTVAAAAGVAPEPQIMRYLDDSGVVHFSNTGTAP